ncbi:MAG: deoxyribodipyrimidine photo-lyase, partial [Actinomycetota bacterium]
MTAVWWIRRDMRLADNGALVSAAARGAVVPLFVWEDNLLGGAGEIRRAFVFEALSSLDAATGGRLVYREGPAVRAVPEFCRLVGAESVHITEDFAPWGRARDQRVERALAAAGVEFVRADTPYVIPPGTVRKDDGTPLKVFTPFYKRWLTHEWRSHPDIDADFADHGDLCVGTRRPEGWSAVSPQPASEAAAWDRFESWSERAMGTYKDDRNNPALDGTSMLSAHLKFGIIHPRQLLQRLDASAGADHFRSEIAWREFYADVLFHLPHTT